MTRIHPTAVVDAGAEIGGDVLIGPYCVIGPNVKIGEGTCLKSHVVLDGWTTLGRECTVFPFACLGTQTQDLKYRGEKTFVEIGDKTTLREYVTVNSGTTPEEVTRVGNHCHIMAYSHVAHGCIVGNEVIMANAATLAGHVTIQDQAIIGGLCGVHQFVTIGRLVITGGCTKIVQDCPPFLTVDGSPAAARGLNKIGMKRRQVPDDMQAALKQAYRILYRQGLSTSQAVEKIRSELDVRQEVEEFVSFVENSERGIVRSSKEQSKQNGD